MPLNELEILLNETVGLDAAALGRAMIERAARERLAACGLAGWQDYLEHVRSTEDELQALVDAVVVPETWFFQDRPAFEILGRLAVQCWLTSSHGEHLRLLSVGCGSGEEPYSMVMELVDAGFPVERLRVEAVDLSSQAIARARQGIYTPSALRGTDLRFSARYFSPVPEGLKLNAKVRQAVTFFRANVLSESCLLGRGGYDFILCRNLLAFFDPETQTRVVRSLGQALNRNGVLFVAPGESHLLTKPEFVPVGVPYAHAFLKAGKRLIRSAAQTARHLRTQLMAPSSRKPKVGDGQGIRSALDLAARLAERGQWADVQRLCEAHIRDNGETAQALYLLGRSHDAEGEIEGARNFYQRALVLNSEHTLAGLRLAQLPNRLAPDGTEPGLQSRAPLSKKKLQP